MASTSSSGNGTIRTSVLEFRRRGDPLSCQRIWDAIKACRKDKHPATLENIQKKCALLYPTMDDKMMIGEQLKYLVLDKLILKNTVMSSKGSNKGSEYFVYSIPVEGDVEYDRSHDWYCFLCHKAGEVLTCVSCPKVYHVTCLEKKNVLVDPNHLTCPACNDVKQEFAATQKKTFNHLLWFASCRLDSLEHKLPERIDIWNPSADTPIYSAALTTDRRANMMKKSYLKAPSTPPPLQEGVDLWRSRYLIHTPMNHDLMMSKADRQVYKSLAQFQLDSETIVHNVTIFHGENSPLADRARMLHRDCVEYELNEIKICRDCYRRSNEQQEEDWFCQPCDPPHELVFAKAKGYPYWPAKVLRTQENIYDVRFFGANHDRASLRVEHIAPITSCTNTLVPLGKRNVKWIKAVDELMKHQKILKNVGSPKTEPSEPSDTSDVEMADDHGPPSPEEEEVEEERPRKMLRLSINVNRLPSYLWSSNASGACATTSATIPDAKVPSSPDCAPSTSGADDLKKLNEKVDSLSKDIVNLKEKHSSELKAAEERYKETLSSQSAKAQREKESVTSQLEQAQRDKKFFSSQLEQTRREKESLVIMHSEEVNKVKKLKEQLELAQQEIAQLKSGNNHELRNEQVRTPEGPVANSSSNGNDLERAKEAVQAEIEALRRAHAYEIRDMMEKHASVVAIIKTKSWCKACDAEGLLHCCLNVWYCSTECQRKNWKDHKGTCKRDRTAGRNQANQSRDSSLLSSTKK